MAINQINPTTNSLSQTITSLNLAYKTQNDITLSNYDNDLAPQVQAGSVFANNGAQFENTSDVSPSGYGGIANSTIFYLYFDVSGNEFIFSSTVPVWDDDKQGWYNGNDRAFFSMYKDSGGTLYQNKYRLGDQRELYNGKKLNDSNYIEGTFTGAQVFTKLAPFIPNTGDTILIVGGINSVTLNETQTSRVERIDATTIRFFGTVPSTAVNNTLSIDSAGGSNYNVSLAW